MRKNAAGNYVLDIRDNRLRGGRLTISTRTGNAREAGRREVAVRTLLEQGELGLIERLRDRSDPLRIDELQRAHAGQDIDALKESEPEPEPERPEPLTLEEAIVEFLQDVKANLAEGTHRQYEGILRQVLDHFGPKRDMASIAPKEWRQWLNEDKDTTGGEPWSQNRRVLAAAVVGSLYNETIEDEDEREHRTGTPARVTRSPLDRVDVGNFKPGTRPEFLRKREWRRLYEAVKGRPQAAFVAVGCLAGLRISEARYLRTDIDVVLDGDNPRIEVQPREGEWRWYPKGYPKHTHSVRTIPLSTFPTLLEILREHVRLGYAGDAYFFRLAGYDRPMGHGSTQRWAKEAFRAGRIKYGRKKDALTYHNLRHSFISWLVQQDYSLMKISKLSGTSVTMITKVYGHLVDENLEQGMKLMEKMLQEGQT